MNLAPNFTLAEFARTNHRDLQDENYRLAQDHLPALYATAEMFQVVRDHFDAPVFMHSGFRCPRLNRRIHGARSSQHLKGEAGDFHVYGVPLEEVWRWVWKESGLPFGQLILEGWAAGAPSWIHLSLGEPWRPINRCRQVLTWSPDEGYHRLQ